MFEFDNQGLITRMASLELVQRGLFSLSCAERQSPLYRAFHARFSEGNPEALVSALDFGWDQLGRGVQRTEVLERLKALEKLSLDTEDERFDSGLLEYAADAVNATHAALQSLIEADPRVATWAARAGYRIVDAHAMAKLVGANAKLAREALERAVLESPEVQTELRRQADDLDAASLFRGGRDQLQDIRNRQRAHPILEPSELSL